MPLVENKEADLLKVHYGLYFYDLDTSFWTVLPGKLEEVLQYGDWNLSIREVLGVKDPHASYYRDKPKFYSMVLENRFSHTVYEVWLDHGGFKLDRPPLLVDRSNTPIAGPPSYYSYNNSAEPKLSMEVWKNVFESIEVIKKQALNDRKKKMDAARKNVIASEAEKEGLTVEEYKRKLAAERLDKKANKLAEKDVKYIKKLAYVVKLVRELDSHVSRFKQILAASNENEKIVLPSSLEGFENRIRAASWSVRKILPAEPEKKKK